jgi:hypothetical protein
MECLLDSHCTDVVTDVPPFDPEHWLESASFYECFLVLHEL